MKISIIKGKNPIIFVAPHKNDENTDIIAEVLAKELDAYAFINVGWDRNKDAVLGQDLANLNSIKHCLLGPVKKEFLNPLIETKNKIIKEFNCCFVIFLHGMAQKIREEVNDDVDIVVGFGAGNKPSYTCNLSDKNNLIYCLRQEKFNVYQGKPNGKFSANNKDNLTQLFRSHDPDTKVDALQLEIVHSLRSNNRTTIETALKISDSMNDFMFSEIILPDNFKVQEY